MDMLQLQSLKEFHELDTTLWGIRQPHPDASAPELFDLEDARLDLVILPGMAFTTCGRRLGHGKGFYDRFLHRYESVYGVRPKTVALALKSQIVDYVPVEEHDVNLSHVLHA
ncbi:5-formyltetrahydrofolate cyclo-ligase family domain-containing protein [Ditylenchus destructor]|nr:5-formyltetrahydrofolate cyclo-ligase family domain-containing protein [Ditylenchus destructor]